MEEGGVVLMDLLWSDPTTNDGVEGVQPSPRGPGLVTFGPDRVKDFCKVRLPGPSGRVFIYQLFICFYLGRFLPFKCWCLHSKERNQLDSRLPGAPARSPSAPTGSRTSAK